MTQLTHQAGVAGLFGVCLLIAVLLAGTALIDWLANRDEFDPDR